MVFFLFNQKKLTLQQRKKQVKKWCNNSIRIGNDLSKMKIAGNRIRTIESYDYIFNQFIQFNKLEYVEDITADSNYEYLGSLEVAQQTKLIRLKSIEVVLSKFHNNAWKTSMHMQYAEVMQRSC